MNDAIETALSAVRQEYEGWDAEQRTQRQEYEEQIRTLEALMKPTRRGRRGRPRTIAKSAYSIGQDKYEMILDYMEKNPRVRQVDLAEELGMNSGTISVGLHKAEDEGIVKTAGTERGSHVWEYTRVPAEA